MLAKDELSVVLCDIFVLFVDGTFAPSSSKSVFVCKKPCFLELEKGVKLFRKLDKLSFEALVSTEHGPSHKQKLL